MVRISFPTLEFRSIPNPSGKGKYYYFFTRAADLPAIDLDKWCDVNPREVKVGGPVYNAILDTLKEEPDHFLERNRGLTLSAKTVDFEQDKDPAKRRAVVGLSDKAVHGVVDGRHTLAAIKAFLEDEEAKDSNANVAFKVMTEIAEDQITEIAGGLNTSQQVDLKSLANLEGFFQELKSVVAAEPYANKIAYKMNEPKDIDVREVLYYLAVLDRGIYTDTRHPVELFGRKEGIVKNFEKQARIFKETGEKGSFHALVPKAAEILRLRDQIEQAAEPLVHGKFTAKKRKPNHLQFLNKDIKSKIHLGWILPMLGGFRANVDWKGDRFDWKVPNEDLIPRCVNLLVADIEMIHKQEGARPEYVGRSSMAWTTCYRIVAGAIKDVMLEKASKRK